MAEVKLQAVVEALEFSSDGWCSFLNRETGEFKFAIRRLGIEKDWHQYRDAAFEALM